MTKIVGLQPEFTCPEWAKTLDLQGPNCRQCAECPCWLRGSEEWVCEFCIACGCRRTNRLEYGAWTRSLLRPFVIRSIETTPWGPMLTLDGFRLEYFVKAAGEKLADLVGTEVSGMLYPRGNLLVWRHEAKPQPTNASLPPGIPAEFMDGEWRSSRVPQGPCKRCGPCRCWMSPDGTQVCRLCHTCGCRRVGQYGRGEWGRALLRPHRLVAVTKTEYATMLTVNGFRVVMPATVLGSGTLEGLVGKRVCGLLYEDGARLVEYQAPAERLVQAYAKYAGV